MKTINLITTTLLFVINYSPQLYGQSEIYDHIDDYFESDDLINPEPKNQNCSQNSLDFINYYGRYDFYRDNYENLPVLKIPISINIWQDDLGNENWSDNSSTRERLNEIINTVNHFYANNVTPEYYDVFQPNVTDFIPHTKIQFILDDRIYFYQETTIYESFSFPTFENFLQSNYPERLNFLNIHIVRGDPQTNQVPGMSNGAGNNPAIVTRNSSLTPENPNVIGDWSFSGHLAHELGHNLTLLHTYDGNNSGLWDAGDACCPETNDKSHPDFLHDVFGDDPNNWCGAPTGTACYHKHQWSCSNGCISGSTNNMMGGTQNNRYFSPSQIAKMHRALSLLPIRRLVICDEPNNQIVVAKDELWDFDIKLYNDIIIQSGNTLTVTCHVSLPKNGRIIVERGAKLIIDGGIVTSHGCDFWQGIEVHGNYQLRQNTSNQGVVEVINDGIIEYARNGIRTIGLNESGTFDWSKTGGIVRINGGVFKDCRRGIEFMSYHNLTPTGYESSNVSYIFNAEFITTDEYLENQYPFAGITMYDVIGIRVKNSIFENQKTDLSNINNTNRGSGIISVDANYNATSSYNFNTGIPIAGTENEFRNLYYGVMTYGGTGRSDVKINDNLFEECIYGVGLIGCNYGIIGRNQFNILEFNNDPMNPIGFGVYTDGAYGFNIEGNNFDILGASTNVFHHAVNVRNSSNNTSSGKVYRNNIDNVYLGTQTIGNNTALRIDCNEYVKGAFSTVDINHNTGVLADQGDCGQFSVGVPVNNTFSGTCNNTTLAQIFKSPTAAPFMYNYQLGSLDPTCHNLGSFAQSCLTINPNTCPVTLANNAITVVDARISLWKSKLGGTKESLNTVREIITYGDREELDLIIEEESNGLSKDSLLAASPYLSDRILIEYLTQSNTPPSGHIKQVLLANSPLTDSVMSFVNGLNLPNGINNQISQAQTGISERRLLEASESNLNTDRLVYIDAIVQEYLDTNWVDSAALFLREEGSVEALCALVPIEVRRKDTIRANSIIDTLRTVASEMESNNTSCKRACELNEFCNFQQFVFRIALRQGGYFSINQAERTVLEQVANSNARVAVNAKAILHFIDETLPMYKGKDLVFPKSMNSEDDVEKLLTQVKEEQEQLFTVHPNPTSGNTVFTIETEEMDNLSIIITNFQGQVIKILDVTSNQVNYNLGAVADGTYLVHLVRGDAIQSTSKLIYAK